MPLTPDQKLALILVAACGLFWIVRMLVLKD